MDTSKTIKLFLAGAACTALAILGGCGKDYPASNEEQMISFLDSQGIVVCKEPESKEILIPEDFSGAYEKYNELQKAQGFDLSDYRAKNATVYTFSVVSVRGEHAENMQAHIIVCAERIIGGDIASSALDGEMTGIIKN